jgi:hypothetical protein
VHSLDSAGTGNTAHLPAPVVFLTAALHFVNGLYYADEAVGSWYTWAERERASEERSAGDKAKAE